MTYYSDMFKGYLPYKVTIKCPKCSAPAEFTHAIKVSIRLRADIRYFEASPTFEYYVLKNASNAHDSHAAVYFPGLNNDSLPAAKDLPAGYSPEMWTYEGHNRLPSGCFLYQDHKDVGSVFCKTCLLKCKHVINWPDEAFFQISYKGRSCWAYDLESATALRDYVKSKIRPKFTKHWHSLFERIPRLFMSEKARPEVVKQLERILAKYQRTD